LRKRSGPVKSRVVGRLSKKRGNSRRAVRKERPLRDNKEFSKKRKNVRGPVKPFERKVHFSVRDQIGHRKEAEKGGLAEQVPCVGDLRSLYLSKLFRGSHYQKKS